MASPRKRIDLLLVERGLFESRARAQAAIEAGFTRFRPVIMTALAMMIGMVPMALGMGEGGEQNAPLGRAVIGGLLCATVATLLFVPCVFALIHNVMKKKTGINPATPFYEPAHQ